MNYSEGSHKDNIKICDCTIENYKGKKPSKFYFVNITDLKLDSLICTFGSIKIDKSKF